MCTFGTKARDAANVVALSDDGAQVLTTVDNTVIHFAHDTADIVAMRRNSALFVHIAAADFRLRAV